MNASVPTKKLTDTATALPVDRGPFTHVDPMITPQAWQDREPHWTAADCRKMAKVCKRAHQKNQAAWADFAKLAEQQGASFIVDIAAKGLAANFPFELARQQLIKAFERIEAEERTAWAQAVEAYQASQEARAAGTAPDDDAPEELVSAEFAALDGVLEHPAPDVRALAQKLALYIDAYCVEYTNDSANCPHTLAHLLVSADTAGVVLAYQDALRLGGYVGPLTAVKADRGLLRGLTWLCNWDAPADPDLDDRDNLPADLAADENLLADVRKAKLSGLLRDRP